MSLLQKYKDVGEFNKIITALESHPVLGGMFENTLANIEGGTPSVATRKKSKSGVSIENWDDLTYKTKDGNTLKIPQEIRDFKAFVEKEQSTKTVDIKEWVRRLKFNKALDGDTIKTVGGTTYKDLDCAYMVPFATWVVPTSSSYTVGNTTIVNYYDVHFMGVVYCDEESRYYGKYGVFMLNGHEDFNNFKLKDHWFIFKYFQPSFDKDVKDLIKNGTTWWSSMKEFLEKIKDKLSKLFKPTKQEKIDNDEESA